MWTVALLLIAVGLISAEIRQIDISVSLSSYYGSNDYPANLCIDGDISNFCHSGYQLFPYLDFDVGYSTIINQISVFNREDCCADRTEFFYVLLKDTPFTFSWGSQSGATDANSNLGEATWFVYVHGIESIYTIAVPNVVARYGRIVMAGQLPNWLNIAEVQVFTSLSIYDNPVFVIESLSVLNNGGSPISAVPSGWNSIPCVGTACPYPLISLDLNLHAGGDYIYLLYKKAPINTVTEFVSDIRVVFRDYASLDCTDVGNNFRVAGSDLNSGAGGKYIYVCVSILGWEFNTAGTSAISELQLAAGGEQHGQLNGFTGISEDLNMGAGGEYIYLRWKNISTPAGPSTGGNTVGGDGFTILPVQF